MNSLSSTINKFLLEKVALSICMLLEESINLISCPMFKQPAGRIYSPLFVAVTHRGALRLPAVSTHFTCHSIRLLPGQLKYCNTFIYLL